MLNPTFVLRFPPLRQAANRWTTFHLRWSFVCRPAGKRQGSCIQNKCRPMRRLTRFLNPPKLGIEQNIVQHAFDEIGYPALRAPLRRRASSHRIALSPGLRQAPHCVQFGVTAVRGRSNTSFSTSLDTSQLTHPAKPKTAF